MKLYKKVINFVLILVSTSTISFTYNKIENSNRQEMLIKDLSAIIDNLENGRYKGTDKEIYIYEIDDKNDNVKKENDVTLSDNIKKENDVTLSDNIKKENDITLNNNVKKENDIALNNNIKKENNITLNNNVKKENDITLNNNVKKENCPFKNSQKKINKDRQIGVINLNKVLNNNDEILSKNYEDLIRQDNTNTIVYNIRPYRVNEYKLSKILQNRVDNILTDMKDKVQEIYIYGYADMSGNYKSNIYLSYDRAKYVANYLIEKGVDRNIIKQINGMGSHQPFNSNIDSMRYVKIIAIVK